MSNNMDVEFISQLLSNPSDFAEVLHSNFKATYLNSACGQMFSYIQEFWQEHGKIPDDTTLKWRFSAFDKIVAKEPISFYIDFFKKRYKLTSMKKLATKLVEHLGDEVVDIDDTLVACEKLILSASHDLVLNLSDVKIESVIGTADKRYDQFENRQDRSSLIPTPWDTYNDEVFGWHNGDLNTILGQSGTGKSWALLLCMMRAGFSGKRVLLFTEEMTIEQLMFRYDAIEAQFHYSEFRKGNLSEDEKDRFKSILSNRKKNGPDFHIVQDVAERGLMGIHSMIRLINPDIVGIDGAYLFAQTYDWKDISDLTKGLKKIAQKQNIPILLTNQKVDKEDGSAYSKSFIRDSSYVIVMYQNEHQRAMPFMKFKVIKNRDSRADLQWTTNWDLERMSFTTYEDLAIMADESFQGL